MISNISVAALLQQLHVDMLKQHLQSLLSPAAFVSHSLFHSSHDKHNFCYLHITLYDFGS